MKAVKLYNLSSSVLVAALSMIPLVSFAANSSPINTPDDIFNLLDKLLGYFATAFWMFAIGAVFYAGYLYLTAAGDSNKLKKAHQMILWTVVAVVIGLFAYGLPKLIQNILTPGS